MNAIAKDMYEMCLNKPFKIQILFINASNVKSWMFVVSDAFLGVTGSVATCLINK